MTKARHPAVTSFFHDSSSGGLFLSGLSVCVFSCHSLIHDIFPLYRFRPPAQAFPPLSGSLFLFISLCVQFIILSLKNKPKKNKMAATAETAITMP